MTIGQHAAAEVSSTWSVPQIGRVIRNCGVVGIVCDRLRDRATEQGGDALSEFVHLHAVDLRFGTVLADAGLVVAARAGITSAAHLEDRSASDSASDVAE